MSGRVVAEVGAVTPEEKPGLASRRHQLVAGFLDRVLGLYVEQHELGVVIPAPFQMRLTTEHAPDLVFVNKAHLERIEVAYLDGPADLVVEILERESAGRDRGEKFYAYAEGGVPEYWLIDPETQWAEFYRLEGNHYRMVLEGKSGRYESEVMPGLWMDVTWLWLEPLPLALEALAALDILRG